MLSVGVGVGPAFANTSGGGFETLGMSGLSNGDAVPGSHAGISVGFPTGVTSWTSEAWGVGSFGNSTYGVGTSPTDFTASDGATLLWQGVGNNGKTYRASANIRYAPGSVTETGAPFSWTIDDTTLSRNFTADFTLTNLTGSYVITGLPTGGVDDGDGTVSGTLTGTPSSGNVVVTFTDQYGRDVVGTYAQTTAYRTQAADPGLGTQNLTVDDDVVNIDASATANGNTLSYGATGLPGNGVINGSTGAITTTGNGGAFASGDVSSGNITVTATDEYLRETQYLVPYAIALRTQAADPSISTQNLTVDDDTVNIDAVATANSNTLTYVLTTAYGDAVINSSTAAITVTSNGGAYGSGDVGTGNMVVTATDEYSRDTVYNVPYAVALRAAMTGGADLDLSFVEDSAITTTNLIANWTLNGNTPTNIVSISPSLPTGLTTAIATNNVDMDGTPTTPTADATYTITVADEYARETSDTFTLEITSASSAPTFDSMTFTDNNDGTPAELTLGYTGSVTGYRVYIATGTDPVTVSDAQLYAGSGGTNTLEFTDFAIGTNIDITGLTGTSESADRIYAVLTKSADGSDPSNVRNVTVSGLDFTAPTFSSAEVGNVDNSTIDVDLSTAINANSTPNASDFTLGGGLSGNSISSATIVGGNVRLALGSAASSGGTLSYTQSAGSIVDDDGNELSNFSAQTVTDNTGSSGITLGATSAFATANSSTSLGITMPTASTDDKALAFVFGCAKAFPSAIVSSAPSGWTLVQEANADIASDGFAVYERTVDGTEGSTITFTMTDDNSGGFIQIVEGATTSAISASDTNNAGSSDSSTATSPTVSATASNAYMFSACQNHRTTGAFTLPSGMTGLIAQQDVDFGGGASETSYRVAYEALSASGATGTRDWTLAVADRWYTVSFIVEPA